MLINSFKLIMACKIGLSHEMNTNEGGKLSSIPVAAAASGISVWLLLWATVAGCFYTIAHRQKWIPSQKKDLCIYPPVKQLWLSIDRSQSALLQATHDRSYTSSIREVVCVYRLRQHSEVGPTVVVL